MGSSGGSDPPSPKTAKIMAGIIKQMERLQRESERRIEGRLEGIQRNSQDQCKVEEC